MKYDSFAARKKNKGCKVKRELILRDYQQSVVDQIYDLSSKGHNRLMIYCPTGGGKTEIAIKLMSDFLGRAQQSVMVMDRIVLCNQTSDRLDKYGIPHSITQAGNPRYNVSSKIQICSAQTLENKGFFSNARLMIIDEAHNVRKSVHKFLNDNPDIIAVGLSATPFTKGIGSVYKKIIQGSTTNRLVERDLLVPLNVFAGEQIDLKGAKKNSMGEWDAKDIQERGIKISGDVVSEWYKKTMKHYGKAEKTIVFSAGVEHANSLMRRFKDIGFNFVAISYRETGEYKKDVIKEFSKPDSEITGLISTDILTKGFDVPDVKIGVSARPFVKSLSGHVQQLGRVMRAHESKKDAIWICHSGNYLRFYDDWEAIKEKGCVSMDDMEIQYKKEPNLPKKDLVCGECGAVNKFVGLICGECGYERKPRNAVSEVSARVKALKEIIENEKVKDKVTDDKNLWLSCLSWIAQDRGYKPAWVKFTFRDRFGEFPSNEGTVRLIRPNNEIKNWIRKRSRAYSKKMKAGGKQV